MGEHPRQTGIRTNLMEQKNIDFSHSLPTILRKQGYTTVYATDESRFSNIDKNYGFDQNPSQAMAVFLTHGLFFLRNVEKQIDILMRTGKTQAVN